MRGLLAPVDATPVVRPVSAVVSTAIAPLLRGAFQDASVTATFPRAAYLAVGDELVAIVTSDGIRLPNAVALTLPSTRRPLAGLSVGRAGRVGAGGVRIGHLEVYVARWWDPRPRLRATDREALRAAAEVTRERLATVTGPGPGALGAPLGWSLERLLVALAARDEVGASRVADRMLGCGPGLTPSGDDLLAGLIAGTPALAGSLGPGPAGGGGVVATVRRVGHGVAIAAVGRTTAVSAALLRHAAHGRLAAPATDLLRAWTRPSPFPPGSARAEQDIVEATDRLLAVGSSSGRDLTSGLLAAVHLLTTTGRTS